MKAFSKKHTALLMVCVMVLSLTGCSLFDSKAKVYSRYITSLLDINYKNVSKDYMTLTGVSQEDAEAVYVANMDYQAHNLMNYYGVKEVDDGTILSEFYYLAQTLFANAKYEVTDVKHDKDSDTYTVELTISPLDTLETSYDDVVAYIENFNSQVDEGNFNDTTEEEYETEFANGIINILKKTADNPGYLDPVVLDIPVKLSADYYSISDEDFIKIDSNILYVRENDGSALPTEESSENAIPSEDNSEGNDAAPVEDNGDDNTAE